MSTAEDIRGAVYQALSADPLINADDVEVDVSQHTVMLNGTVPSQQASAVLPSDRQITAVGAVTTPATPVLSPQSAALDRRLHAR